MATNKNRAFAGSLAGAGAIFAALGTFGETTNNAFLIIALALVVGGGILFFCRKRQIKRSTKKVGVTFHIYMKSHSDLI